MILHICPAADWAVVEKAAQYRPASLDEVGFVHCSDRGTVRLPANALYAGRDDLLLLEIDPVRLDVDVRWEPGVPAVDGAPWFPHVYGPIPVEAVAAVHPFPPEPDGRFELPETLRRPTVER